MIDIAKNVFDLEISELQKIKNRIDNSFNEAINLIYSAKNKRLIVSGIGKSGNIGKKIVATLCSTGTQALFLHPIEALHGDLGLVNYEDVFLLISNSGETEELLKLVENIKRFGGKIISFVGNLKSSLGKISDVVIDTRIDKEACPLGLAPTSSTTAQLVMGDAMAVALLKKNKFTAKDYAFFHPGGSLGRKLFITVSDLMHTGDSLPKISKKMLMKDALFVISEKGLGIACVVDKKGIIIGLITDGDIRRLIEKHGNNLLNQTAESVMNTKFTFVEPNIHASRALKIMENLKITSLPVLDSNKCFIGLIHIHDILEAKIV